MNTWADPESKRVEAERAEQKRIVRAQQALHLAGKCASHDGHGNLCTLRPNHKGRQHETQVRGGIDDGKVLATWPW